MRILNLKMTDKVAQRILLALFSLIVFLAYSNRIDDLDFWWHLKYGEIMYETLAFPEKDDFAFTTYISDRIASDIGKDAAPPSEQSAGRTKFWLDGVKRAWLSDLILYASFLIAGFPAVGVLKASTFVVMYLVIYLAMRKRGSGYLSGLLVLSLVAVIGTDFGYTRPQIFSFLLFSCVLYILYSYRAGPAGSRGIYWIPALMLIWANLHGGFILGMLIILAFLAGESLKYLAMNVFGMTAFPGLEKRRLQKLAISSFLSFPACLLNPTGYKPFIFPFIQESSVFKIIEEYVRPMLYEYHAFWLMLALVAAFSLILAVLRRLDITDLLVSAIVAAAALTSIRFIPFFALGTAVFLSYAITLCGKAAREWAAAKNLPVAKMTLPPIYGYIFLMALAVVALTRIVSSGQALKMEIKETIYPSGAVAFLKENKLKGKIFNLYNWGGYIIWRLYPDFRTFVDGRNTSETAFVHYNEILSAEEGSDRSNPLWKKLLNSYGTDIILISAVSSSGVLHPLAYGLYADGDWELVFTDGQSLLFVRKAPHHLELIQKYRRPKDEIIDEIIAECEKGISETPATWGYYELLGYMYLKKDRPRDALRMFKKYLSMNPYNERVKKNHDVLEKVIGGR